MLNIIDYDEKTHKALSHFGIKGMRWGVRRERGPDGLVKGSEDYTRTKKLKKKKVSELSNVELKQLTERMGLEQRYKDLNKQKISAGRKMTQDILKEIGKEAAKETLKSVLRG